jgi:hypothetical protein
LRQFICLLTEPDGEPRCAGMGITVLATTSALEETYSGSRERTVCDAPRRVGDGLGGEGICFRPVVRSVPVDYELVEGLAAAALGGVSLRVAEREERVWHEGRVEAERARDPLRGEEGGAHPAGV